MHSLTYIEWVEFLKTKYPEVHLLQTGEWGELKKQFNWRVERIVVGDVGAQILFRRLPLNFNIAYIPKGPVGRDWTPLWKEIDRICHTMKVVCLIVEPDEMEPYSDWLMNNFHGFIRNEQPIQPRRSILVDLEAPEDSILGRMKQKTRYNIRLAEKKGVKVIQTEDISAFHRMMVITSERDKFGVHSENYYQSAYNCFSKFGNCVLLFAQHEGTNLAGLMVFKSGKRAWYLYGASVDEGRSLMPTYLLQWEAMRWATRKECKIYDLWGVPDFEEEELEQRFMNHSDGLWGVYRFKRGFGGNLVRSVGAWDRVYQPALYKIYTWWLKLRRDVVNG